jgi:hypothetical protein
MLSRKPSQRIASRVTLDRSRRGDGHSAAAQRGTKSCTEGYHVWFASALGVSIAGSTCMRERLVGERLQSGGGQQSQIRSRSRPYICTSDAPAYAHVDDAEG